MFDSIYVDDSMALDLRYPDGTLPDPDDEWQTKDLTDCLREVVLKDFRTYARRNKELKEWPFSATFTMYSCKNDAEYMVTVENGLVTKIGKPESGPSNLDLYPFLQEDSESLSRGMDKFIQMCKELDQKRTWYQRVSSKLRRIKNAFKYGFQTFKGSR